MTAIFGTHALGLPFGALPAGLAENIGADLVEQSDFLGDLDEIDGPDKPAVRMAPAHQSFRADDRAVGQRDLRLVEHFELVPLQREPQFLLDDEPAIGIGVYIATREFVRIAARCLGLGEAVGRAPQQCREVHAVFGRERHADRARDRDRMIGDFERPPECAEQARRELARDSPP